MDGGHEAPEPRPVSKIARVASTVGFHIIVGPIIAVVSIPVLLGLVLFKRSVLAPVVRAAKYEEFEKAPHYKDAALLARVWASPVGQLYLRGPLEYQRREGYCSIATQRNLLKSLPGFDAAALPPATGGAATATEFTTCLTENSRGRLSPRVIFGSEGEEAVTAALRLANDPGHRVAVNFLHATLSGTGPLWLPWNMMLGVVSGHFSVVLGYLEAEDLVAVFDVNDSYGAYLVERRRLLEAIAAPDLSSNRARALIVVELVESSPRV
ncbi:hypothetical protein ACHHYP_20214 [Achlya hypogyna]|uniref:Uncharacterized protein n=1 Tax=Achlya hypogyna TaxID=1202772 RepID=A0A1V9YXW1_ACHHY|nr:hypothetical protein ACHHYP_20214 [Achlya hypogyna]